MKELQRKQREETINKLIAETLESVEAEQRFFAEGDMLSQLSEKREQARKNAEPEDNR